MYAFKMFLIAGGLIAAAAGAARADHHSPFMSTCSGAGESHRTTPEKLIASLPAASGEDASHVILGRFLGHESGQFERIDPRPRASNMSLSGLISPLSVDADSRKTFDALKFNDLFIARESPHMPSCGLDPIAEPPLRDVRPVGTLIDLVSEPSGRHGILFSYQRAQGATEELTVFLDGSVELFDVWNTLTCQPMDHAAQSAVLDALATVRKGSPREAKAWSTRQVAAFCDSHLQLDLEREHVAAAPLTAVLDTVIDRCRETATITVKHNGRREISDWAYADVQPLPIIRRMGGAVTDAVPVPGDLLRRLTRHEHSQSRSGYFRSGEKTYYVTVHTSPKPGPTTWRYVEGAEARFKTWPADLSFALSSVAEKGVRLPRDVYLRHRTFLEKLYLRGDDAFRFTDGRYAYDNIWFERSTPAAR